MSMASYMVIRLATSDLLAESLRRGTVRT